MRDSGSVKLYWSLSCGSPDGGVGERPGGLRPERLALASRSSCRLASALSLLGRGRFLSTGLEGLSLALARRAEVFLAQGNLVAHVHTFGYFVAIGLFGQPKQLLHFGPQVSFQLEQALVTDGLTLVGIGVHLRTVDADVAELEVTGGLGQQQDLDEQLFDLGPGNVLRKCASVS